jgi:hypothetical protein
MLLTMALGFNGCMPIVSKPFQMLNVIASKVFTSKDVEVGD